MVSSQIPDTVRTPAQVIQSLWKSSRESAPEQDVSKLIDDFPRIVGDHFRSVLNSENGLKEIYTPPRDYPLGTHPPHSLIRMRLMVQDNSISPDIYLAQQPTGLAGGWAMEQPQIIPVGEDQAHPTVTVDDVDYSKLRERHVMWAVQVPGESKWPSQLLDLPDETTEENKPSETRSVNPYAHKSPSGELGIQIKLYGEVPKLSPTDVATFVGVFDHEPYAGSQSHDSPLAPTLHVVYWHRNPTALLQDSDLLGSSTSVSSIPEDWQSLVGWISESLGGDLDAAEWIALCVASDCDTKPPNNLPVSLTLTCFPPSETPDAKPKIARLLEQLLPLVSHIPLTLDMLNTKNMSPCSEASNEDLHAGRLQLPSGSVVIFDERIQEGKLGERGVENVRVIQDVLMKQSLAYRFPYSSFDFKTNITSVILTEGKREALFAKTDFCVPIRPNASSTLYSPITDPLPTSSQLHTFRQLVFRIKHQNQPLKAEAALTTHVQEMFVRDRQMERASGGRKDDRSAADEYGLRMRLSRTMALALGLTEITCDAFDRVVALDKRRIQRLQEIPLGSGPSATQPVS